MLKMRHSTMLTAKEKLLFNAIKTLIKVVSIDHAPKYTYKRTLQEYLINHGQYLNIFEAFTWENYDRLAAALSDKLIAIEKRGLITIHQCNKQSTSQFGRTNYICSLCAITLNN